MTKLVMASVSRRKTRRAFSYETVRSGFQRRNQPATIADEIAYGGQSPQLAAGPMGPMAGRTLTTAVSLKIFWNNYREVRHGFFKSPLHYFLPRAFEILYDIDMECKKKENAINCLCSHKSCEQNGVCCECLAYHRGRKELPGCFFSPEAEKTDDRSIANFIKTYRK